MPLRLQARITASLACAWRHIFCSSDAPEADLTLPHVASCSHILYRDVAKRLSSGLSTSEGLYSVSCTHLDALVLGMCSQAVTPLQAQLSSVTAERDASQAEMAACRDSYSKLYVSVVGHASSAWLPLVRPHIASSLARAMQASWQQQAAETDTLKVRG